MSFGLVASFTSSVSAGFAVPENRDPIGDSQDLVEPMRDKQDAASPRAKRADDPEQPLRFLRRKRGGRLVHDEDARPRGLVLEEGGGDPDQHPIADRQFRDDRLRVDMLDAQRGKRRMSARVERPPIDKPEAARIDAAEKDVLGHAEAWDDVQFLMDEPEAAPMRLLRAAERSFRAFDPDLAAVRGDRAGEDLDQRALAGAVLAHKGERLSGRELERSVPQRRRAAIGLAQMSDRKQAHGRRGAAVRQRAGSTAASRSPR